MEIRVSNCTFLFGNGFDLSLGMKTRYIDMYSEYIKSKSLFQKEPEKKWIAKFKDFINNEKPEYKTWSDFELALGKYSKNCDSAEELIKCERDFKLFLKNYLKKEEERMIKIINKSGREYMLAFSNFCYNFYQRNDLTENEKNTIKTFCENAKFNYISFNYTQRILNNLVAQNRPLFIHGTLNNDIVLGVDNETQISLPLNEVAKRAIIKPIYTQTVDINNINKIKNILWNSKVICSYGLSFGASDLTWIKEISKIIISNNCLWVHYIFMDEELVYYDLIDSLDQRDNLKEEFLKKLDIPEENKAKIKDKVYIFPIAESPFKFPQQTSDDLENERKEILNQVN